MTYYQSFINNQKLRRGSVLFFIVLLLVVLKSILPLILLTFIFTFLAVSFDNFIRKFIKIPSIYLTIISYVGILLLLYIALTQYIPLIINQSISMFNSTVSFYKVNLDDYQLLSLVLDYFDNSSLMESIKNGATFLLDYASDIGHFTITVFFAFMLSFFFMLEKNKTIQFSHLFLSSEFSWFFKDVSYFFKKFVSTFGVVIEAQLFISMCNTILTTIALALFGFSQLPSLALMIFLLGLVPVAGVIISSIPLSFIAFYQGGLDLVIYVLIAVIVVHMLETYVLNPKFISNKTHLPIFYTFVILLFSETFFGIWGLVLGIPTFMFFLDLLNVKKIN